MTDIIKGHVEISSKEVKKHIKENPDFIKSNIEKLKEELKFIKSDDPILIAFGGEVYNILKKNLPENEYRFLVKITHYSDWRHNKEVYRKMVIEQIFDQTEIDIMM